ncbi:hypothetical protein BsWGS_07246 [Bradybaena similaris]
MDGRLSADFEAEMQRFRTLGRSAFVMGYSGVTGKALTLELNKAKVFKKVVLIGRREIPLGVGPEFEQRVVDFDKIEEHKDAFRDLDVGFCCLGVHSRGTSQEDYVRFTRDYCVSAAKVAKEQGCNHFTIVTVKGANKNSSFFPLRIKAELEEKLEELNFDRLSIFRPTMILGKREQTRATESASQVLFKPIIYLFPTLISVPVSTFARGMIVNAVRPPNPPIREIYENKAIHELAKNWQD